jgi:hypothetical protein
MMHRLFSLFSILALMLVACGGEIDITYWDAVGDGTANETHSQYGLDSSGACMTNDGTACLFGGPSEPPDAPPPDQPPPPQAKGGCWVTGIGTFGKGNTRDSFGGNGMYMKDGSVRGEWQHTDHYDEAGKQKNGQNLFHGKVNYLVCKKYPSLNGPQVPKAEPNFANWGGTGRYNGVDGYFFDVKAFDHAEGGIHRDRYVIRIFSPDKQLVLLADGQGTTQAPSNKQCLEDVDVGPGLEWVKAMGCLSGGNFQIHPPNKGHPY